jgi:hypothetical protein
LPRLCFDRGFDAPSQDDLKTSDRALVLSLNSWLFISQWNRENQSMTSNAWENLAVRIQKTA